MDLLQITHQFMKNISIGVTQMNFNIKVKCQENLVDGVNFESTGWM